MRYVLILIELFVPISICLDCFVYMDRFTEDSYLNRIVEQIKKCNYTLTKITIINTIIVNLDFLKSVRHIETLHVGPAIFISNNRNLRWDNSSFKELKSIKSPHHYQEVTMITISDNINSCVEETTREKFRNALMDRDKELTYIQPCMCEMNSITRSTLSKLPMGCEFLFGNLFLNKYNTKNKTDLEKLKSVRKIYGRVEVYKTELEDISFLANLTTIDERVIFTPHIERWSSSRNATLVVNRNMKLTKFGLENLTEIHKNPRTQWIYSVWKSPLIVYTENERRYLQSLMASDVKYQEMNCEYPYAPIYISRNNSILMKDCTVISTTLIIFDENSPSEEAMTNLKWEYFDGCLLISNTSFTSLDFLRNVKQINCSYTNEMPAVNITNNRFLKKIDFDAMIIRWNYQNTTANKTVYAVDIRDNPLICHSSIEQLMNQTNVYNQSDPLLLTKVFFIGSANNATCNYKFHHEDSAFSFLLLTSLMFSIIIVGLIYILNKT